MVNLVEKLKTQYDYILIDCPAGIEQGFRNAIAAATTAVVVTTPEVSAIRDADRIIVLDDGKIQAIGSHDELINTNDIYREIYEGQTKGGGDFDEN